jgi:hypothetical protein
MHMQNPVLPKVIPQVFPRSHHSLQLPPIDHLSIGKPPLRPIHPHSSSAERSIVPLRPAMNLIPLRHRPSPSRKTENNGDGIFTVATVSKSTQSTIENVNDEFVIKENQARIATVHHFESV